MNASNTVSITDVLVLDVFGPAAFELGLAPMRLLSAHPSSPPHDGAMCRMMYYRVPYDVP